jgi:hypothetical protein
LDGKILERRSANSDIRRPAIVPVQARIGRRRNPFGSGEREVLTGDIKQGGAQVEVEFSRLVNDGKSHS